MTAYLPESPDVDLRHELGSEEEGDKKVSAESDVLQ